MNSSKTNWTFLLGLVLACAAKAGIAGDAAGQAYEPLNDPRWDVEATRKKLQSLPHTLETVEALKREVQERFIAHIDRAKNVTVPYDEREVGWKVDWAAQQAYCHSIADALFKRRERLSFPKRPDAALLRDGPEKVMETVKRAYPNCKEPAVVPQLPNVDPDLQHLFYRTPRRELDDSIASLRDSLYRLPHTQWNDEHYIGDHYWIRVRQEAKAGDEVRGDTTVNYTSGTPCPDKQYSTTVQTTAEYHWSLDMTSLLALVDGQPTVFQFGVYGRVHRRSDGQWTDEPETAWDSHPSLRVGRPGQGFVFVDGLQQDLYKSWARSEVQPEILALGVVAGFKYNDGRHLLACVINFDLK